MAAQCDATRPSCTPCRDHSRECSYVVNEGESRARATKRKYEELEESHKNLTDFVTTLPNSRDQDVTTVMRRVRNGESRESLLPTLKNGAGSQRSSPIPTSNQRAKQVLLLQSLLQGTDSLPQIIIFVEAFSNGDPLLQALQVADFDGLRNRIFSARALTLLLQKASSPAQIGSPSAQHKAAPGGRLVTRPHRDETLDMPLRVVSAKPWTRVTDDDLFVSRLDSIYLNHQNPFYCHVEADLFLQGTTSGLLKSEYCSPFLVNAICALACLSVWLALLLVGYKLTLK